MSGRGNYLLIFLATGSFVGIVQCGDSDIESQSDIESEDYSHPDTIAPWTDAPEDCIKQCESHGLFRTPSGSKLALKQPMLGKNGGCVCGWSEAFKRALQLLRVDEKEFRKRYRAHPRKGRDYLRQFNADIERTAPYPSMPKSTSRTISRQSTGSSRSSKSLKSFNWFKAGSLRLSRQLLSPFKSPTRRRSKSTRSNA